MKNVHSVLLLAACIALGASALAGAAPAGEAQVLPIDRATVVNGIEVACTGVGETRQDSRWRAYPVRVEFSDSRHEYLTDAAVTLATAQGRQLLQVSCSSPWVLIKPPAGAYQVTAQLLDSAAKPRSAPFKVPAKGQLRVVLEFPDA